MTGKISITDGEREGTTDSIDNGITDIKVGRTQDNKFNRSNNRKE